MNRLMCVRRFEFGDGWWRQSRVLAGCCIIDFRSNINNQKPVLWSSVQNRESCVEDREHHKGKRAAGNGSQSAQKEDQKRPHIKEKQPVAEKPESLVLWG